MIFQDKKITEKMINHIVAPMKLDLIAYFSMLEESIQKVVNKANREKVTPEELQKRIGELF